MPLESDTSADVAIVGGGIAGLSVAYAVAREGGRPIVLERDAIAGGEIVASLIRVGRHADADLFDPERR